MSEPRRRALRIAGVAALICAVAAPAVGSAAASISSSLAQQQSAAQSLRAKINDENRRLANVQGSLSQVQARLAAIDAELSADRAKLTDIQTRLRAERARLVQLEMQLQLADQALTENLRSQFETDPPDAMTVILQSHGFADLLDRLQFVQAARRHDKEIINADQAARRVVVQAATELGALEVRQQALTQSIQQRAADADRIRIALLRRSIRIERARNAHAAGLRRAQAREHRLTVELARLSGAPSGSVAVGHVLQSGGFVFPMPAGAAVGPGSWSDDQGVDIAAAGGTPLLAVGSGTVVLHGIGGFGPWAPVLHLDSPIGGYSYVYYGHAGPANAVPIGTHVSAGQVISEVGPGIVGISTGPHLEIGFANAGGGPVGGGSAQTMHSLLLAAYHG